MVPIVLVLPILIVLPLDEGELERFENEKDYENENDSEAQQIRPRLPAVLWPGGLMPTQRSSMGSLARW
jgi:hypothetical protein